MLHMNAPALLLRWISSFLRDRTVKVRILDHTSRGIAINYGVPQGIPISPFLFLQPIRIHFVKSLVGKPHVHSARHCRRNLSFCTITGEHEIGSTSLKLEKILRNISRQASATEDSFFCPYIEHTSFWESAHYSSLITSSSPNLENISIAFWFFSNNAQWSDQWIITEKFGQFLIFIISTCGSVIILTYMHVPYGGGGAKLPLIWVI